jgi:L-gulono-1,4-lactone dehydrogenase
MWQNWSGELACHPQRTVRPVGTLGVAEVVRTAAEHGRTVRPVGAGHSFTPLAVTDDVLVDLGAFDQLLEVDTRRLRVRVQAGIRLGRLAEALARHGLGLENLGDIDRQTLAGAIGTGTHGTGARLGNLSTQVESLRLVDGLGRVHELADGDRLRAARIGLGALGIVTEVTLRVVPAFTLRGHDRTEQLEDVLTAFDDRVAAHRHFELFAFPYSDRAITRTNDVVDAPPQPPTRARAWYEDRLMTTHALGAVSRLGRRFHSTVPPLNRLVTRLAGERVRVDAAHRVFASARDVRFTEMELAVPRAAGVPLVREILELVSRERFPVNWPVEVRTAAGDDALLSPAHERDSVYVAVHAFVGMPYVEYFDAVWELARRHGARPHWGKRHPATALDLRQLYPRWDEFQAVRAELDPHGRFTTPYLERILGPRGRHT